MKVSEVSSKQERTRRIAAPFSRSEIEKIDEWGFAHKIRDRSTVMRALIEIGLKETENEKGPAATAIAPDRNTTHP